ncbi:MAG TPA: YeeE/YedE thiosulfate transporter family protein [Gemmatimonadota bacterium]|nr:YeeE/YedE thiosulfate transporter family protein [Gemmatimonadota bacterium]
MSTLLDTVSQPWPWYVAGPAIGLLVTLLLLATGKGFGVSSSFQHICSAAFPGRAEYFRYDWRRVGLWNLVFVLGMLAGGLLAGWLFANPHPVAISEATREALAGLGIRDFDGLVPDDLIGWKALATLPGFVVLVIGGFLVGFGARWAGGCTSGHAITGLAGLQKASLVAVMGFFAGGLAITHLVLPLLLR